MNSEICGEANNHTKKENKTGMQDDDSYGDFGKVQILLSTYNGEEYIREQLDSILGQSYPEIYTLSLHDALPILWIF